MFKKMTYYLGLLMFIFVSIGNIKGKVDFALTQDIEKDLSPETPLNQRTKVIKELSEAVLKNRLEDVRA
jgi:hypothetical protein